MHTSIHPSACRPFFCLLSLHCSATLLLRRSKSCLSPCMFCSPQQLPMLRQSHIELSQMLCLVAVAQSKGPVQSGPTSPPHEIPTYERASWSRQPHPFSISNTTLQQLWLNCPDSFSRLLTPQLPPTQSMQTQINSISTSLNSSQSLSAAVAKLTCAVQQHVQMLACGNSTASVAMLHELTSFLEGYQMHTRAGGDSSFTSSAAAQRQLSQRGSHPPAGDESAQVESAVQAEAADAVATAALQVAAVLVAHDEACQQAMVQSLNPGKAHTQVSFDQTLMRKLCSLWVALFLVCHCICVICGLHAWHHDV